MTISSTLRVATFIGNGVATVFPFTFPVYDSADLEVRLYNRADNTYAVIPETNYTVTGIGLDSVGGAVTYNPGGIPIPSTQLIAIYRTVAYTQDTDITNQDGFYPDVLEKQLDKIVMQIQQIAEEVDRTFIFPPTVDITSDAFVALVLALAGKLIGAGTVLPATRADGSALESGDIFVLNNQVNPDDNGAWTYVGPGWAKIGEQSIIEPQTYIFATNGQTTVNVPGGYQVGTLTIYRNGVRQIIGASPGGGSQDPDCRADDGLTIVFPAATLVTDDCIAWTKKKPFDILSLTASDVEFTPAGGIAASTVQQAIVELDTEKLTVLRQITTSGLLTGGGDLTADRAFSVPAASDAETIAGSITNKATTPAGVKAAITAAGVAPSETLITSGVLASAGTIPDLALSGGWRQYILMIDQLEPVTAGHFFAARLSFDGGSTFKSGASDYKFGGRYDDEGAAGAAWNSTGATSFALGRAQPAIAGNNGRLTLTISVPRLASYPRVDWVFNHDFTGPLATLLSAGGKCVGGTGAPTHIRLFYAGNVGAGASWQLYGKRN